MAKVRRTKIIIEETSEEETSTTRVFVNGEKFQEIDFTDSDQKKKTSSKKTTKKKSSKSTTKDKYKTSKSKTSAKKESSTKAPKSKSNTKKKTSTSKSKKKTSTKASTKKKDTDVKKEVAKEITQLENKDKATTQEVIELPLVSEDKDKNNGDSEVKEEKELSSAENLNENDENDGGKVDSKNDKESENKEPDNNELKESVNNKSVDTNNIPILLNDNSLAPLDSSNNKETIDNPEIIDGTRKTENEVKVKDQNLDTLEADIVEKEKLDNKKEQEKKETEESKVTQKEDNAKSSKDKSTTIKENKEETKLKTEKDTKTVSEVIDIPNKEGTSTKANAENEKDTSKEEKLQEKSNDNFTYTYVAQEENIKENDDSFKSKLKETFFSKKGLIIGGLILVVLIAILVPVSINLSNKEEENDNRIEINESDILKENFISAGNFFDRLTNLQFSFRDYRSKTSTLTTELTYSCKDDIYSFNLTSNVYYAETQENAKTIDTLEYDISQNNYLLTTTIIGDTLNVKDKEERCTKNQAKNYLKSVITNFYDNYLSYNAISIQSILDEVSKKEYNEINYYINSETNVYIIEDKSQSLRIIIDESGINTWTRYTTGSGICIPESSSDPAMLLYEINTDYELN